MARVYNQLPSAIPTANDGVRMNDENHFFKEQKSQFEEEDVALSCNHYKRIRHLVSHKRWEHYLSSKKKWVVRLIYLVWLLDETKHDISLHAKTVKAPIFLKSPNYLLRCLKT